MSERKNELTLGCRSCGKRWEIIAPTGVTEAEWEATINAQACPECKEPYRLTSRGILT